jgi:hypothetical protein
MILSILEAEKSVDNVPPKTVLAPRYKLWVPLPPASANKTLAVMFPKITVGLRYAKAKYIVPAPEMVPLFMNE